MKLSYNEVKRVFESKQYVFFDHGAYNLNLFGIRSNDLTVNEFNDYLGVAYRDELDNPTVLLFRATTKPGLYWLKNDLGGVNGTAILIPGQYRSAWMLGYHKGYEALQQKGEGVFKVWRDADKDGDLDLAGPVYADVRGLNGHTTSFNKEIDKVGMYSAGCQVVQSSHDFQILISIVKKATTRYSNSFTYTLLMESDIQ